jgi:glutamate formiminotransferase/formiminotetrahydrofolate cyclodeaminase
LARIIECVPNFSEGRDASVISALTRQIESVDGVRLLDVDSGKATHRTVVTFVGPPEQVCEAAFRAVRQAMELIDMRRHRGEHPRFGATDVLPLVPVSGVTMEEAVELARKLGQRIGEELGIPVYCYEAAAFTPARKNLADVRAGEYEGLAEKLSRPEGRPDFGPARFLERTGAVAVGARDFLIAYNINLNTTSVRRANAIAYDVREKGRPKTVDGTPGGEVVRDAQGREVWEPGSLKCVKGIGWYIEEYGIAQISLNLTNIGVTPMHVAFDEVCRKAEARGVRVTGSEVVGLLPLRALQEAGRYFLRKQRRSTGVSERELVKIAVKSLGLNDLYPFKPEEKVIEYLLADRSRRRLAGWSVQEFVEQTASESPAPGGGSASALAGALGAALATMVANLSSHKRGWDERWEEFSDWAERGKTFHEALVQLIDEDTDAFHAMMAASGLPRGTTEEKAARASAMEAATRRAIEVPLRVMELAVGSMEVIRAMAAEGLPASVSDAGVAAACAAAAVTGAHLNVRINAPNLADRAAAEGYLRRAAELSAEAASRQREVMAIVEGKLA